MQKILKYLVLLLCIVATSCVKEEYEWEEFKPIPLKYSNVDFMTREEGFLLRTIIPYLATTVSFSPEYPGSIPPQVDYLKVDDVWIPAEEFDLSTSEGPVVKGEWGEMWFDNYQGSFTIHLKLTENPVASVRKIRLRLNGGYDCSVVEIFQEPNPNITE